MDSNQQQQDKEMARIITEAAKQVRKEDEEKEAAKVIVPFLSCLCSLLLFAGFAWGFEWDCIECDPSSKLFYDTLLFAVIAYVYIQQLLLM